MSETQIDKTYDQDRQKESGQSDGEMAPKKWLALLVTVVAVSMSIFHLYTGFFGSFTEMIQCSVHVLFVMLLIFLLWPTLKGKRGRFTVIDGLFCVLAVSTMGYLIVNYNSLIEREGAPITTDIVMGVLAIILVLEATSSVIPL